MITASILFAFLLSLSSGEPTSYRPVAYSLGKVPGLQGLSEYAEQEINISSSTPLLTLDYGSEVAGFPFLEISAVSIPAQVELKYTEAFDGLNHPLGDGPWTFANGLSNTFRTETFNITKPGRYESYFIQGGLRWQSLTILSGGPINISAVGLRPSVNILSTSDLPGSFETSKQSYTNIWNLGVRAVQVACVDAGSQPSTWDITSQGALIRGQAPAQSVLGVGLGNYTLSFKTKIVRGGTGWRVAAGIGGDGPYFVLTSNYSSASTYANTNRTLLPPNSLISGYGWSIVNQSTLASGPTQSTSLMITIKEGEWYEISTTIGSNGYKVSVNGHPVASLGQSEAETWLSPLFGGGPYVTDGTWGFGPFSDQVAYFTNVSVTAQNGTIIYNNTLNSSKTLAEYGVAPNYHSYCLDGAKRDRLIWIGDFVHTARTVAASTNRQDYVVGLMKNTFERQLDSGLIPTNTLMGSPAEYRNAHFPASYLLTDYQIFFLTIIGEFYQTTGDLITLSSHWNQTKLLTSALLAKIDSHTGLMGGGPLDAYFTALGYFNATAPTALFAVTLQKLSLVAKALNDTTASEKYISTSVSLNIAINALLWSDTLGTYSNALLDLGNFSLAATAFTIMSGAANKTQITSSISKLSELFYHIGYKDSSSVISSATTQLSPNTQGFLLESLFLAHLKGDIGADVVVPVIKNLLDLFWPSMLRSNSGGRYYSGATWEYVLPDGSPGIGLFTSLNHPWGSAPTYVLSSYILGIRPVNPGYERWDFEPVLGGELGLTKAKGTVPTPRGVVEGSWDLNEKTGMVKMTLRAPKGTSGNMKWLGGVITDVTIGGKKQAIEGGQSSIMVEGEEEVVVILQTRDKKS